MYSADWREILTAGSLTHFHQEGRPHSAGSLTLDLKLMALKRRQLVCWPDDGLSQHFHGKNRPSYHAPLHLVLSVSAGRQTYAVGHLDQQIAAAKQ